VLVDDASHNVHIEQADAVAAAIIDHLFVPASAPDD
jgi:pimeloyl-ACP methyl ester carboxylesterase